MFGSAFYDMLYKSNLNPQWRRFIGTDIPDLHMKDVEMLLRGFAMLVRGEKYSASLVRFLYKFSENAMSFDDNKIECLEQLLCSFLKNNAELPDNAFYSKQNRFSPTIFESVFVAACDEAYKSNNTVAKTINPKLLEKLKKDDKFNDAAHFRTTNVKNVKIRLERARKILVGDCN